MTVMSSPFDFPPPDWANTLPPKSPTWVLFLSTFRPDDGTAVGGSAQPR